MSPEQLKEICLIQGSIRKLIQEKELHELLFNNTTKISKELKKTDPNNEGLIDYHNDLSTDFSSFQNRIECITDEIRILEQKIQQISQNVANSMFEQYCYFSFHHLEILFFILVVVSLSFFLKNEFSSEKKLKSK